LSEFDEAEFEMALSVIRHFLDFQATKLAIETIFGGARFGVGDPSEVRMQKVASDSLRPVSRMRVRRFHDATNEIDIGMTAEEAERWRVLRRQDKDSIWAKIESFGLRQGGSQNALFEASDVVARWLLDSVDFCWREKQRDLINGARVELLVGVRETRTQSVVIAARARLWAAASRHSWDRDDMRAEL